MNKKDIYNGQTVMEVIQKRSSVRTYKEQSLSLEVTNKLSDYLDQVKGPFDAGVRFMLAESQERDSAANLGTYGVIKNAPAFLITAAEKQGMYMEQMGYELEKIILYATSLNLGTCWLGGTFKKSGFAKTIGLNDDEILPVVSPVGYPADNRRFLDKAMRLFAGSDNRKGWDELFFKDIFNQRLDKEESKEYSIPLEMVRLAPSASNKQPWRVVMKDKYLHFFLLHNRGYEKGLGFDIQKIDMGIATCHFELSARELGIQGDWVLKKPEIDNLPREAEYIISWEIR
jgi:Nitroreductase family.